MSGSEYRSRVGVTIVLFGCAIGRSGTKMGDKIRFVICEDYQIFADALSMIATLEPELEMVAPPVPTAELALHVVDFFSPDVVLMDVQLAGRMDGIEATRRIANQWPKSKVVILTGEDDEQVFIEAVEAGASGFLRKGAPVQVVLEAMRRAVRGENVIDSETI